MIREHGAWQHEGPSVSSDWKVWALDSRYHARAPGGMEYRVDTAEDLLGIANPLLADYCRDGKVIVFTSATIDRLYGRAISDYLAAHRRSGTWNQQVLESGEHHKNLDTVQRICQAAKEADIGRGDIMVAVGGGVVCDLVGFAASMYARGIRYIKVNTTLVGQIDVGVGIKTGVNFAGTKNALGAFYPAYASINDRAFLKTLDVREIRCGLAEIIKLALVLDRDLFELLEQHQASILASRLNSMDTRDAQRDRSVMHRAILGMMRELCPNLYERRSERLADFGHSFSPVIEVASRHSIKHGEAVAIVMALSARVSVLLGRLTEEDYARVLALLIDVGLPVFDSATCRLGLMQEALVGAALRRGQKVNLVIPTGIGQADFLRDRAEIPDSVLAAALVDVARLSELNRSRDEDEERRWPGARSESRVQSPSIPATAAVQDSAVSQDDATDGIFAARFYITFRCNSRCGYCNVWQDDKFDGYDELTLEQAIRGIDQLRDLGVRYVDFTGGEPSLYRHIAEVVRYAASVGMVTEITSNGIVSGKRLAAIAAQVDAINLSLDSLDPEKYLGIRGVDAFSRLLSAIEAIDQRDRPKLKLMAVMTPVNVDELPALVAFAQDNRIAVNISTMFEYFDGQDVLRKVEPGGCKAAPHGDRCAGDAPRVQLILDPAPHPLSKPRRSAAQIAKSLLDYLYHPFTQVNLHFLKYVGEASADAKPNCFANKRILTLGPDGRIVLPCYHVFDASIPWTRDYRELIRDPSFVQVRDQEVGQRDECAGCTVFPYIGLSFSYVFNRYFFYQAISEELLKLKTRFINPVYPRLVPDSAALLARYRELEHCIDSGLADLSRSSDSHDASRAPLVYPLERGDGGIASPVYGAPVGLAEIIADNLHEYCWDVEHSPHFVVRLFYKQVLPALHQLRDAGAVGEQELLGVLAKLYAFHLDWWTWFIARYFRCKQPLDGAGSAARIEAFFVQILRLLPADSAGRAVKNLLFTASCVLGSVPSRALAFATTEAFPEERLACRYVLVFASEGDRHRLAQGFSPRSRELLSRETLTAPSASQAVAAGDLHRIKDLIGAGGRPLGDYAVRLADDRETFYRLLDAEPFLDIVEIETLIGALKNFLGRRRRGQLVEAAGDYLFHRPEVFAGRQRAGHGPRDRMTTEQPGHEGGGPEMSYQPFERTKEPLAVDAVDPVRGPLESSIGRHCHAENGE